MEKNKNIVFAIIIIILTVAVIIVMALSSANKSVIKTPNSKEISAIMQNKDIIIIDVRTADEYKAAHVEGAVNIPNDEIENRVNYDKNKPIAVYCQTGVRSSEAAKTLEKMGYTKIYDLGGIENFNVDLTTN